MNMLKMSKTLTIFNLKMSLDVNTSHVGYVLDMWPWVSSSDAVRLESDHIKRCVRKQVPDKRKPSQLHFFNQTLVSTFISFIIRHHR